MITGHLPSAHRWLAAALVTVVTLLLVGTVVASTTKIACSPANRIGLHLAACEVKTAGKGPFPTIIPGPSPRPGKGIPTETPTPLPTVIPPTTPPASAYPPATPPESAPPPQDPIISSPTPPGSPFSCRLPVYAGPPGSGGFVVFPGGTFVADPRSAVALPSPSPGAPSPAPQQGYGAQQFGMTYDRIHSRWLPVGRNWVAPDGNHYAYPSTSSIYLVDAATNTQVEIGKGNPWNVLRVLDDRVYATIPNAPGFWVVPFSGAPHQVTSAGYWTAASATAAYGSPTSAVPSGATQKVVRLDIAAGSTMDWFVVDGASAYVSGFDQAGDPLVYASYLSGWAIWETTSPIDRFVVASYTENLYNTGVPVADSHGIWIPVQGYSFNGIALYVRGSGLYLMTSIGGQLAGGCD